MCDLNVGRDVQTQIDDFRISSGRFVAPQPLAPDLALKCGSARPEVAHCFGRPWRFRLLSPHDNISLSFVESSSLTQNFVTAHMVVQDEVGHSATLCCSDRP